MLIVLFGITVFITVIIGILRITRTTMVLSRGRINAEF